MAMIALRCTQCGAELELDNSREFGFCSCCGTKIMLKETTEVIHSGEVQMVVDNSRQGYNRLELANVAFESGNYEEAYRYYTKTLEDLPENITALYRKGICAIYLSQIGNLKVAELKAMLKKASEVVDAKYDRLAPPDGEEDSPEFDALLDIMVEMESDIAGMIDTIANQQTYYIKTSSEEVAINQSARWTEMTNLYRAACKGLTTFKAKEVILEDAANFCSNVLKMDVEYYSHTTRNKKGKEKDHYKAFTMPKIYYTALYDARNEFRAIYNELPSVVERNEKLATSVAEADTAAQTLQMEMTTAKGILDNAKSAFYNNNPEFKAQLNKSQNMAWLCLAPAALFLLFTLVSYSCGIFSQIIAVIALLASFKLKRNVAAKAAVKLEEEIFPDELKELENKYYDAVDAWEANEQLRKDLHLETVQAKRLGAAA